MRVNGKLEVKLRQSIYNMRKLRRLNLTSVKTLKTIGDAVVTFVTCVTCNGDGFTLEHANHPHPEGDCLGYCPIQEPCNKCSTTGKILSV